MKILVDQNISFRLVSRIASLFPETYHVKQLDLINANDYSIFRFARQNDFGAVLTLDEDFYNIQLELGPPPKIIWLRVGNCSTAELAAVLLQNIELITIFLSDEGHDCLEIFM